MNLAHSTRLAVTAATAVLVLSACAGTASRPRLETEAFGSTTTHSRSFAMAPAFTCEAARRALLSQGFVITSFEVDVVKGRKNFQPEAEVHVQLDFNIVCAADGRGGRKSIAFVNALQDRYALKKSSNSASVGVGPIGSLSLPFSSSDDSLVKVASETITSAQFYDRFFTLLQRYLAADSEMVEPEKTQPPLVIVPLPPAAAASATPTPTPIPPPPTPAASAASSASSSPA